MFDQNDNPRWGCILPVAGIVTILIIAILYAFGVFGFLFDTQVNNKYIQPAQRSRLDNDASYRRGIEAQARGDVAAYQTAIARLPQDRKALEDWQKANPGPNYTIVQQEQYQNLSAQLNGDTISVTNFATEYNNLLANPDNAGLRDFDPDLPASLDPSPTP